MKIWKSILLAVLLGPVSELVIFAANILHDEPWEPTPAWLMAIGISLYYSVGQVDQLIIEWIIHPIIFLRKEVSGIYFNTLYLVIDTAAWSAMIYCGIIVFRKGKKRVRRYLGHSGRPTP